MGCSPQYSQRPYYPATTSIFPNQQPQAPTTFQPRGLLAWTSVGWTFTTMLQLQQTGTYCSKLRSQPRQDAFYSSAYSPYAMAAKNFDACMSE
jgi:hypothetical protein